MEIRLAGITQDSIVDGPGFRLTVFTQGCERRCKDCHNPESQALDGGFITDTAAIVDMLRCNPLQAGITLTGGEPFLQPEACADLAGRAQALGKSVWAYTGYTWEELREEEDEAIEALLRQVDVLVDGPFVLAERTLELRFRGSRNQRLIDVRRSLDAGEIVLFALEAW